MRKKKLSRKAGQTVTTTLFANTTIKPTFVPTFRVLTSKYENSITFQTSLWAETEPGIDPDGTTFKSTITVQSVDGSEWPVGYDEAVIIEVSNNVEGTIIITTFTIILDGLNPEFFVQPAVIELSYPEQ